MDPIVEKGELIEMVENLLKTTLLAPLLTNRVDPSLTRQPVR
jgi:hypothetical protein